MSTSSGPFELEDFEAQKALERDEREADLQDEAVMREGEKARRVLTDPVVVSALQNLEDKWMDMFRRSSADQADVREEVHRLLNVLGKFKEELRHQLNDGTIAGKRKQNRDTERAVRRMEKEAEVE